MKNIAWLIGFAALIGSAGYLLVYVATWQWNRALFSGIAMITTLVSLGIAMVLRKLSQMEDRLEDMPSQQQPDTAFAEDLRRTRPRRDHFAWLQESTTQTNVFITMLLGGGAIVSGIAWLVGRIGESTATPQAEKGLAERMGPLAFPDGGLRPSADPAGDEASLLLRGPGRRT